MTANVRDFLNPADLGYRYDRLERPKLASPASACAGTTLTSFAEGTPDGPITDPATEIKLRLAGASADAAPRGSKPTLRLLLRDMTWQSKVDVRFEVRIGPADPNTKDAPVLLGDSHFYFFADPQHEAHAGEHSEEFAVPRKVWIWATRSKSTEPLTVYLKRMPLAPDAADVFDAASQPRIGSVQLLLDDKDHHSFLVREESYIPLDWRDNCSSGRICNADGLLQTECARFNGVARRWMICGGGWGVNFFRIP